nr:hypothetical transcript [Hymenolepis microstoma]
MMVQIGCQTRQWDYGCCYSILPQNTVKTVQYELEVCNRDYEVAAYIRFPRNSAKSDGTPWGRDGTFIATVNSMSRPPPWSSQSMKTYTTARPYKYHIGQILTEKASKVKWPAEVHQSSFIRFIRRMVFVESRCLSGIAGHFNGGLHVWRQQESVSSYTSDKREKNACQTTFTTTPVPICDHELGDVKKETKHRASTTEANRLMNRIKSDFEGLPSEDIKSPFLANEQERSRDPIEIFDELDRKRAEGEFRPELIDTTEQPSRQGSRRPSLESNEPTLKKLTNPSGSSSFSSSMTLSSYSSRTSSANDHPIEVPKRKLPVVHQNNRTRRLPLITRISERSIPIPKRTPQISIPILRSHRILPGGGNAARRQLPNLDCIIENPQVQDHFPLVLPSTQIKKVLPSKIIKGSHNDGIIPSFYSAVKCNGGRNLGDSLMAPRHPLIRTETETTYLTSSVGEPHQIS